MGGRQLPRKFFVLNLSVQNLWFNVIYVSSFRQKHPAYDSITLSTFYRSKIILLTPCHLISAKSVTTPCETKLSTNEVIAPYVSRDRQFPDVHFSKKNEATREASLEESVPAIEDEASYDGLHHLIIYRKHE